MSTDKQQRLIYLLRHGLIDGSQERRYIGHLDISLSPAGRHQAGLLQTELASQEFTAVLCSDLCRSIETASIITANRSCQPQPKRELREISMGEWEGKTFREIAQTYPSEYAKRGENLAHYRIPGGESFAECQQRIVAAFTNGLQTTTGNLLIVGHAGINRLLLCHILGMPLERLFQIRQDYACINLIAATAGQYCVRLLNAPANARGLFT